MSHGLTRRSISGLLALVFAVSFAIASYRPAPAQAGAVDGNGSTSQYIGYRVEEYDYETSWGECYGACGPGCSYNCGGGGACQTHDFYMRKHGLWSWQQFATFPGALVQWGACVTGRAIDWVNQNIISKVTNAVKSFFKKVAGIFN
jgi:hypothetical protein